MTNATEQGRTEASDRPAANDAIRSQKTALRKRMRKMLAVVGEDALAEAGRAAAGRVVEIPAFCSARRVAVYLALPHEMPTWPLIERCWREGKELCVPAHDAAENRYRPAKWTPGAPLRQGRLGVMEPISLEWIEPQAIDVWIVPGLAFSITGERLGRGKGAYDRMLLGVHASRVGWALDMQLVEWLPVEAGDVLMNWVVTERRTVNCACRSVAIRP